MVPVLNRRDERISRASLNEAITYGSALKLNEIGCENKQLKAKTPIMDKNVIFFIMVV
jgi:hypothetical protein